MKKIIYLYTEVMPYTVATINAIADQGVDVTVVHWDKQRNTPYLVQSKNNNIAFITRSSVNFSVLKNLIDNNQIDLICVSGWQDKLYILLCSYVRIRQPNIRVVCMFDDQWHSTFRQRLLAIASSFGLLSRVYTHAWVCGAPQYEYAKRLSFQKRNIIMDLYSADRSVFNREKKSEIQKRKVARRKDFLFVGRLCHVKGVDILVEAWGELTNKLDWKLHIVGNGPLESSIPSSSDIVFHGFLESSELSALTQGMGCFVLPSRWEPWGVVVHEFAYAGLPLITSDIVGSSSAFLIDGFNGFVFPSDSKSSLKNTMEKIIGLSADDLMAFSTNSVKLSDRITPETSARNLLSIL